jgi:hypothetical protein
MKYYLFALWCKIGCRYFGFKAFDIYSRDRKNIVGVTFSTDEKYLNKVGKIK